MKSISSGSSRLAPLVLACLFAGQAHANTVGFNSVWDPADTVGNLLNGYTISATGVGQAASVNVSADHSQLTLNFNNPTGVSNSIFTQYAPTAVLPSGVVSYHWSITLNQSATWLFETDAQAVLPTNDAHQFMSAGTYSGDVSLNYTTGGYFSFGNVGFGSGTPQSATVVLSNFSVVNTPEPGSLALLVGGGAMLAIARRRKKAA